MEPQAEWVRDKDKANFCGYFDPRVKTANLDSKKASVAKDLANLFGDSLSSVSEDQDDDSVQEKLKQLFKK